MNKPNDQTYIPQSAVPSSQSEFHSTYFVVLLTTLPLKKIPFVGKHIPKGKRKEFDELNVHSAAELPHKYNQSELEERFGKGPAVWLYQ